MRNAYCQCNSKSTLSLRPSLSCGIPHINTIIYYGSYDLTPQDVAVHVDLSGIRSCARKNGPHKLDVKDIDYTLKH